MSDNEIAIMMAVIFIVLGCIALYPAWRGVIHLTKPKAPSTVTLTASATFSWPASVHARDAEMRAIKKRLAETIAERIVESDIGELECDGELFRLTVRCLAAETKCL